MVISKQELTSKGIKEYYENVVFNKDKFADNPLIISLDKVEVHVTSQYVSDLTLINVKLDYEAILHSTRSLKPVPYKNTIKDEFVLVYAKDETFDEDTMVLFEGDNLELDDYFYSLIVASLPLKVIAKDDEFLRGDSWEVISEDDFNKRQQGQKEEDSPFASLKDLDLN